jgi:hypothetical protein
MYPGSIDKSVLTESLTLLREAGNKRGLGNTKASCGIAVDMLIP